VPSRYNATKIAIIAIILPAFLSGIFILHPPQPSPTAFNRPNLLAPTNGETAEGNRILAALDGGTTRGASTKKGKSGGHHSVRKRFIALWLVPAGVLTAWVIHQSTQMDFYKGSNLASSISEQNVQLAASNPPPLKSFAPAKIAVASQAAVIADEVSPQSGTSPETPASPTALIQKPTPLEDSSPASTGALLEALEGRSTSLKDASVNPKPNARKSNQATAGKKSNQTASGKNIRKPPPQRTKQKPRSKDDTDVALLTALVSAVNEPEKPAQSSAPKLSEPGKKSTAANRDIVERTAQDSTESLLARCKRLGVLEGELCRWRICSGHDSDPACKVQ
jgi:hypothetical protein